MYNEDALIEGAHYVPGNYRNVAGCSVYLERPRFALVDCRKQRGGPGDWERIVWRYLPDNYQIVHTDADDGFIVVAGDDFAGWTLNDYVIPRLQSGWWYAQEITPNQFHRCEQGRSEEVWDSLL